MINLIDDSTLEEYRTKFVDQIQEDKLKTIAEHIRLDKIINVRYYRDGEEDNWPSLYFFVNGEIYCHIWLASDNQLRFAFEDNLANVMFKNDMKIIIRDYLEVKSYMLGWFV